MRILDIGGISTSLGEIMNIKFHLDLVKHNFDQIKLNFHRPLLDSALHTEAPDWSTKKILWDKFFTDIGSLFFGAPPYLLTDSSPTYTGNAEILLKTLQMSPQKAELGHLMCKGTSLNVGEYIVITTKVRQADRFIYAPLSIQMWPILRELSKKYKIVILGERKVEMRKEYGIGKHMVYGIYEEIKCNLPNDKLVDLTVPALGETVSDLTKIQQDCLIMKEAKFVLTIGIGGNFCMSTSTANMAIGFRTDNSPFADVIFGKEYPNAIITKDWSRFVQVLKSYL